MDKLSKLLISIDAVKAKFNSKNKVNADDYYQVVSAVDDATLKLDDGGMLSFYQLKGFSRTLSNAEKRDTSKKIERELSGYMCRKGFSLQIVDIADPEITRQNIDHSMSESIAELNRMGIGHPVLTEDYAAYIASKSVWKEQFLVVYTSPLTLKGSHHIKATEKEEEVLQDKSLAIQHVMRDGASNQGLFLSQEEKAIIVEHRSFRSEVYRVFTQYGSIISKLDAYEAINTQKRALYGSQVERDWRPTLSNLHVKKDQNGKEKFGNASIVEQVISVGGTEAGLPPGLITFGNRYMTTLSLTIPQGNEKLLSTYLGLISKFDKSMGYISSFRMSSDPFSFGSYKTEKMYTMMSSILPFTDNLLIQRGTREFRAQCDNNEKVGIYFDLTITLHGRSIDKVMDGRSKLLNANWNEANFRSVELNKTESLFDTLPGTSKKSHSAQVLESFSDALYQSPLFTDGILYSSGFLHLFTEMGQPFPLEEHSDLNMNFNGYITGTSGAGKSTILTMLNMALLAKPKLNPKLRGEFPLIMDVDFGKTSFGFKSTLRALVGKEKRRLFLMHEMSTDLDSAVNPHDLPFGRVSPTVKHKDVLVGFLMVLISGVKEKKVGFEIMYPEMEGMIKYLVDTVYDECLEENNPKMFQPAEFDHPSTIKFLEDNNIPFSRDHSYYYLSDLVMYKAPKEGLRHAMILRRYGYPRLGDYTSVLSNRSEIGDRFSKGVVAMGLSPKDFFIQRMSEVRNEFPCFSSVTKINFDIARMISVDIQNVCGESVYRKSVFASLCLMIFLVKRENLKESEDLLKGVKPQYISYLKRLSSINTVLPGALNIEEAHVLFSLFDRTIVDRQRQNRKANWGLRTLSQNLVDPSSELFSLCSTVIIGSEQTGKDADTRLDEINASRREKQIVRNELNNRTIMLYVKTKPSPNGVNVSRIAVPLKAWFSPGLIWASTSDQTDIDFKDTVIEKLGVEVGLRRLCRFFESGNVKSTLGDRNRILRLANERGLDSVYSLLMDEITTRETPSEVLSSVLN